MKRIKNINRLANMGTFIILSVFFTGELIETVQAIQINEQTRKLLKKDTHRNQWGHAPCAPYYNGYEYKIPAQCVDNG